MPIMSNRHRQARFITALLPIRHPGHEGVPRHGLGEEIALRHVAAGGLEEIPILPILDALGHRLETQLLRQSQARLENRAQRRVRGRLVDETPIDLEFVEWHVPQLRQGRIAGAEDVDRQAQFIRLSVKEIIHIIN